VTKCAWEQDASVIVCEIALSLVDGSMHKSIFVSRKKSSSVIFHGTCSILTSH